MFAGSKWSPHPAVQKQGTPVNILGLSGLAHDSAAALLSDDGILAAMGESKLVRRRTAAGIPREAIRFCLFGEPLVVSPRDAVRSYFCSGVDALSIESFLLAKS